MKVAISFLQLHRRTLRAFGKLSTGVVAAWGTQALDWDDLRFFLAVARSGTLAGAASALSSSSATVGRRIQSLERALGATCFVRLPTGYELTEAGRALLADAGRTEEMVRGLLGRHGGGDANPVGEVRLAAPPEFAEYLLIPLVPALLERHPGLRLELVTGVEVTNVNRMDVDVAFRSVRPEGGSHVRVRRLADFPFSLYGSRGFAEHFCPTGTPRERLPLISRSPALERLPAQQWVAQEPSPGRDRPAGHDAAGGRRGLPPRHRRRRAARLHRRTRAGPRPARSLARLRRAEVAGDAQRRVYRRARASCGRLVGRGLPIQVGKPKARLDGRAPSYVHP